MKSAHMLRLIGLMVVIAMLAMAAPVIAQTRNIELDPEEGTIGTTITIAGEGFNKSTETTDRYAVIFFSNEEASTLDDIDSDVNI